MLPSTRSGSLQLCIMAQTVEQQKESLLAQLEGLSLDDNERAAILMDLAELVGSQVNSRSINNCFNAYQSCLPRLQAGGGCLRERLLVTCLFELLLCCCMCPSPQRPHRTPRHRPHT